MIYPNLRLDEIPIGIAYMTRGRVGRIVGVFTRVESSNGRHVLHWEFPFDEAERGGQTSHGSLHSMVGLSEIDFYIIEEVPDFAGAFDSLPLLASA